MNFKIYFLEFSRKIVFGVILAMFISLAFWKWKKAVTFLKLFWYKNFVHFKLKLLDSYLISS